MKNIKKKLNFGELFKVYLARWQVKDKIKLGENILIFFRSNIML